MAENAAAIFPAADMRQELRIPDGDGPEGAALSASMARHIEAAISHIERRTSLALVDRARDISRQHLDRRRSRFHFRYPI